ncbi:MAG TPA: polymer-forming cytoskeletal protein [Methyloversatilis sp.]
MFNKPGLFPKNAESHGARTIRPAVGMPSPSSLSSQSTGGPAATSPARDTPPPAPATAPAVAETAVRPADAPEHGSRLIVGPDVKLKGAEILDCDTLVVEGRVEATMDSRVIRIAEHGAYSGTVGIDVAEIRGQFDGELTARKQLIVHATGRVSGKIRYGSILIEEGGEISGDVQSLSGAVKNSTRQEDRNADEMRPLTALVG